MASSNRTRSATLLLTPSSPRRCPAWRTSSQQAEGGIGCTPRHRCGPGQGPDAQLSAKAGGKRRLIRCLCHDDYFFWHDFVVDRWIAVQGAIGVSLCGAARSLWHVNVWSIND
mmetsp:Transcript_38038/g.104993  ORF Transcript_38038/g.104993 Transcript_38038/m.104993 type:complete len:113 (-) Transcript_38038:13-351(-)|eukprot:6165109-Prymnesium_polylepis.1